jgi:hypothetical protein
MPSSHTRRAVWRTILWAAAIWAGLIVTAAAAMIGGQHP